MPRTCSMFFTTVLAVPTLSAPNLTSYSAVSPTANGTDIVLSACATLVAAADAGPAVVGVWAEAEMVVERLPAIASLMSADAVTWLPSAIHPTRVRRDTRPSRRRTGARAFHAALDRSAARPRLSRSCAREGRA